MTMLLFLPILSLTIVEATLNHECRLWKQDFHTRMNGNGWIIQHRGLDLEACKRKAMENGWNGFNFMKDPSHTHDRQLLCGQIPGNLHPEDVSWNEPNNGWDVYICESKQENPGLCASGLASGKLSSEIPVVTTPNVNGRCGFETFSPPVLAECTEPLAPGVPDLRGFWRGFMGKNLTQRIEQCGDRVVIAAPGSSEGYLMRDMLHADGTYEHGLHDYQTGLPACVPMVIAGAFVDNCLDFMPEAMGGMVSVRRCAQADGSMLFEMIGRGAFPFTLTKKTTVTCQQLEEFYETNQCGDTPDGKIMVDTNWCGMVHENVLCADIKHHYTANRCCAVSPETIVNKPGWCSYSPS